MVFGFPAGKQDYYILQNGQTSCDADPVSHLMDTYCFFFSGGMAARTYMSWMGKTCLFKFSAKYVILFYLSWILLQHT